MVSGTRCPAWSDQIKKWSESRVILRAELRPKWSDFMFERAEFGLEMADFGLNKADLGLL